MKKYLVLFFAISILFVSCSSDDDNSSIDDSLFNWSIIKTEIIPIMQDPQDYDLELTILTGSEADDFDLIGLEPVTKEIFEEPMFATNSTISFHYETDSISPNGYVFETSEKVFPFTISLNGTNHAGNVSEDTDLYQIKIYADDDLVLSEILSIEEGNYQYLEMFTPDY